MFKRVALATLLLVSAPIVAANAQVSFAPATLFDMTESDGNQLQSHQSRDGGANILYSAKEDTLRATQPRDVRMAATHSCFNSDYRPDMMGKSLGEMFDELTARLPKRERVVLQIARVFYPNQPECAAIWFAYTEK